MPLPSFARITSTGVEIRLKVIPGAKRSGIVGVYGDRLKVRVAAAPEDGKANRAVLELLATIFKKISLRLIAGHTHAEKTILLEGISEETALNVLLTMSAS